MISTPTGSRTTHGPIPPKPKTLRIGIAALGLESANDLRSAGIARYAAGLIDGLASGVGEEHEYHLFLMPGLEIPQNWANQRNFKIHRMWQRYSRWNLFMGGFEALRYRLDYWISTAHTVPIWSPAPTALMVHDLFALEHPEWLQEGLANFYRRYLPSSIRRATTLLANSGATRAQLIEILNVPPAKITITPLGPGNNVESWEKSSLVQASELGCDSRPQTAANAPPRPLGEGQDEGAPDQNGPFHSNQPPLEQDAYSDAAVLTDLGVTLGRFIFTLSTLEPRKNLVRLIEAFAKIKRDPQNQDVDLVIGGGKGWGHHAVTDAIQANNIQASVKLLGYVSDSALPQLFGGCAFYICPSLQEGFGMPVLEALLAGAPVLSSSAGALKEVGGDAVRYFDPLSVDSIAQAMTQALTTPEDRPQWAKRGREQGSQFSWPRTAQLTIDALESQASISTRNTHPSPSQQF